MTGYTSGVVISPFVVLFRRHVKPLVFCQVFGKRVEWIFHAPKLVSTQPELLVSVLKPSQSNTFCLKKTDLNGICCARSDQDVDLNGHNLFNLT